MLRLAVLAAALASVSAKGRVVRVEVEPAKVVEVPGGTFLMGLAPEDLDAADAVCLRLHGEHRSGLTGRCAEYRLMAESMLARDVHVSAFAIDRLEVSVAEYRECVHEGECALDPLVAGDERHVAEDTLPIVNVTWDEARQMCAWKGGRLPTEAEWEKAARGDDGRRWPWGDRDHDEDFNHGRLPAEATVAVDDLEQRSRRYQLVRVNWTEWAEPDDSDGFAYAAPVGSFPFGDSPFGTLDQAGNVAEWVIDEWTDAGYATLDESNPVRGATTASDVPRVVRGGSWVDPLTFSWTYMRSTMNWAIRGTDRFPHVGFRCAYDR